MVLLLFWVMMRRNVWCVLLWWPRGRLTYKAALVCGIGRLMIDPCRLTPNSLAAAAATAILDVAADPDQEHQHPKRRHGKHLRRQSDDATPSVGSLLESMNQVRIVFVCMLSLIHI